MEEDLTEREQRERYFLHQDIVHSKKRALDEFFSLSRKMTPIEILMTICEDRIKALRTEAFIAGVDITNQALAEMNRGTASDPIQGTGTFNPTKYGGKVLCIVVSYKKAGYRDLLRLAKMLKRADKNYGSHVGYKGPVDWYENDPSSFKRAMSKLRAKAKR